MKTFKIICVLLFAVSVSGFLSCDQSKSGMTGSKIDLTSRNSTVLEDEEIWNKYRDKELLNGIIFDEPQNDPIDTVSTKDTETKSIATIYVNGYKGYFIPNAEVLRCDTLIPGASGDGLYYVKSSSSGYANVWGDKGYGYSSCVNNGSTALFFEGGKTFYSLPDPKYAELQVRSINGNIDNNDKITNFKDYIWPTEYAGQPGRPNTYTITIEISNTADCDDAAECVLSISSLRVTGLNSNKFYISQELTDSTIEQGDTARFKVTYDSQEISAKDVAAIKFNYNGKEGILKEFTINLEGTTAEPKPQMKIRQASKTISNNGYFDDFTSEIIPPEFGESSNELEFIIRNTGQLPLQLTNIISDLVEITGDPELTISQQPLVSEIPDWFIDPQNYFTTFKVKLTSSVEGSYTARISIPSNDSDDNPYEFDIVGEADINPFIPAKSWQAPGTFGSTYDRYPKVIKTEGDYHCTYFDLIDMNNDNKPDRIVAHATEGLLVAINNGNGFDPYTSWQTAGTFGSTYDRYPKVIKTEGDYHCTYFDLIDMNNDNKPDRIVAHGTEGLLVAINNGNGFDPYTSWQTAGTFGSTYDRYPKVIKTEGDYHCTYFDLIDMNNDNKPDRIVAHAAEGLLVAINNGNGFDPYTSWQKPGYYGTLWDIYPHIIISIGDYTYTYFDLIDLNGNGYIDQVFGHSSNGLMTAVDNPLYH